MQILVLKRTKAYLTFYFTEIAKGLTASIKQRFAFLDFIAFNK